MRLEITEILRTTSDSVTIRFKKEGTFPKYRAGQHGIFRFEIDGQSVSRSYSFHTSPHVDDHLAITVKAVKDGIISQYLINNRLDSMELESVEGEFIVEPSAEANRHLIMFAGGSGITPLVSMIRSVLFKEPRSVISLVYSNSSVDNIILRDELMSLQTQFSERLTIYHVITGDLTISAGFPLFHHGRLSRLVVKKLVKDLLFRDTLCNEFYLCGPYEFMKLIDETLKAMNVDRTKIFREHFFIPSERNLEFNVCNLRPREVIIQLPEEERLLVVGSGRSILEAAIENNIQLPHSCKEGKCGTCRMLLTSGQVKLRRNHILSEDEIKARQVLLCQAYPLSDDVIVTTIY